MKRTVTALADRTALIAVMLLPVMLLHARAGAEAMIGIADVCFLLRSAIERDWVWLRPVWMSVSLLWWAWLVICSAPVPALGLGEDGLGGLAQAVALIRFLVLLAVLEHSALRTNRARQWMYGLVTAASVWIAAQCLLQAATGRNLWGNPRGGDGELTGPFRKPRAGPPLSRILLPVLLPPAAALLLRRGALPKAGAYVLLLAGLAVMVLIGQRMPLLLTALGLAVSALLLKRLRPVAVVCVAVMAALVAATVVISPRTYHRLVLEFSAQMDHFPDSHYGELYARAWEIAVQHPATGRGVEGFRTGCELPRYFRPTFDGRIRDGGGAEICANHPHNFYFEALDEGGFPGLVLFSGMAAAWLAALGRGLWHDPDPLRVGLFASAFIQLWPVASTSAFDSMPMGGWLFLLLGWGLAEGRWRVALATSPVEQQSFATNPLEAAPEPG